MANETFAVYITEFGIPKTGLTPTWSTLTDQDGNAEVQPTITEVGGGFYKFTIDITYEEIWMGVVDAGLVTLGNSERYVPVVLKRYDSITSIRSEVYVTPMYNEDADALTFITYLMQNGGIVSTPTSVSVSLYDSVHTLKFTVTATASTNGVFVVSKSGPSLTSGEVYYAVATIISDGETHVSVETALVLE